MNVASPSNIGMRKTHFSQGAPKDNLKSKTNLYYQNKRNKYKHALNIHVYVLSYDICLKIKKQKLDESTSVI